MASEFVKLTDTSRGNVQSWLVLHKWQESPTAYKADASSELSDMSSIPGRKTYNLDMFRSTAQSLFGNQFFGGVFDRDFGDFDSSGETDSEGSLSAGKRPTVTGIVDTVERDARISGQSFASPESSQNSRSFELERGRSLMGQDGTSTASQRIVGLGERVL